MLYAVIAALLVVVIAIAVPLLRRPDRRDEVDRFRVARSLTTSWSQPSDVRFLESEPVDD